MPGTDLYIKNMVCPRCIAAVREELEKLNLNVLHIELGKAVIDSEITVEQRTLLRSNIEKLGFELIDDKKSQLIDKIKTLVIEKIHHNQEPSFSVVSSDYISKRMGHDYSYLSNLFSSVEGITIEKYIISQKIEKVKELLVYDEMNISEIAFMLGYSSVQHLSNQFKKITGLTPSQFKKLNHHPRKTLDSL